MHIEILERLELLKLEMQLLQQRLTKYDELIWAVRGWAVTLTVALTSWASTKLDDPAAMVWILRVAAVVPAFFWIEEGMLRTGYVAKYIDRYRLLRSALNRPNLDLETIPLYDLTSHYAGRTPRLTRLLRSFLRSESVFLYLVLTALPLLVMIFPQTADVPTNQVGRASYLSLEDLSSPWGLPDKLEFPGSPGTLTVEYRYLAEIDVPWRCS